MIAPPSPFRNASGAPGAEYWQQRADYIIKAELDESNNILVGEETITYYNNSPDILERKKSSQTDSPGQSGTSFEFSAKKFYWL